jgi:hypothetical protein
MSEMKEWTLMFYLAGDNALAPVIVSQLKAIKDAGFQENIDVLIHFDPNALGAPTRIFDVNRDRKRRARASGRLRDTLIGDHGDPFVRSMREDNVDPDKIIIRHGPASKATRLALKNPDEIDAEKALINFLGFCRENHRAKRYILFLLGHGMVVGNDAFLPDDNPFSAITLKTLGKILTGFTAKVRNDESTFELLALHSCSMSAIEVAYELKDTANYMMASEGPSFVGSWPYRQLLEKIFNNLEQAKETARAQGQNNRAGSKAERNPKIDALEPKIRVRELVESLFSLTLHNATDFVLAGYSHDLALCSLDEKKFTDVTNSIKNLVGLLIKGLRASSAKNRSAATRRGQRIKELVLLAHWEAQSYWEESYTDLFDFCRCLRERCNPRDDLAKACSRVIENLDAIVIRSENFGSKVQYSHGVSIYFPWSSPVETVENKPKVARGKDRKNNEDEPNGILERYGEYVFTKELKENSWLDFLKTYFKTTKRKFRQEEDGKTLKKELLKAARQSFHPSGALASLLSGNKPNPELNKTNPETGVSCTCPSIKNYPDEKEFMRDRGRKRKNIQAFQITEEALEAFE